MRGVASGGDGNHSGSLPSVGVYLDEQPVTTIGGTLDVHIYDIARIESLARAAGHALRRVERSRHDPHHHQQARAGADYGRVDGEINRSRHGGIGGKLEA
jgi:iron complex outermembrane receptor protein